MEKVTLPKEVAEAVEQVWEDIKRHELDPGYLIKSGCLTNWTMMRNRYSEQERILYAYFEKNPVEYVSALVYGYEVKKTPAEELREYYEANEWQEATSDWQRKYGRQMGVIVTLNTLGIEIEGINA